jgi:hypothetical protein
MNDYLFIYEDQLKNDLKKETRSYRNLKTAKYMAKEIQSNSMLNDLHKIRVIYQGKTN